MRVTRVRFAAYSLFVPTALACAAPALVHAQAGVEYSTIAGQSVTTLRGAPAPAPEWSAPEAERPASRFTLSKGWSSWFGAESSAAFKSLRSGGPAAASGRAPVEYEVVRPARPKSGAPGKVAGLVYERDGKRPLANVYVGLVSTEPEYKVVRLEARTDSAGYYEFKTVEPGRWAVQVIEDRLPTIFAPPRIGHIVTVAKRQAVAAPALVVTRTACVSGHAVWGDGYVLYDAPLTIAPYDSTFLSTGGLLNGVGDFNLCGAPTDSVMVWMHLRDGRSLGRATRLDPKNPRRVDFKPDPIERMDGCVLRVLAVTNERKPVGFARITVVGRRFEQGARPALVYVREERADGGGVAEFKVPFGVYEVLAINPREGQVGRVQRMIVDTNQSGTQPLEVVLRGQATPSERASMHAELLNRAETYLYVWTQ
ncbi:MAG: hypothetical protein ACREOU_05275 [Candidatus Eiseniibacteriota bacterium]